MFNREPRLNLKKRPKNAWSLGTRNEENQKLDGGAFQFLEPTYAMYNCGYTQRAGYIISETHGADSQPGYRSSPVQVYMTGDFYTEYDSFSNSEFCGAKRYDDTLWVWGHNNHGQLGQGDTSGPKRFLSQIRGKWDNFSVGGHSMAAIDAGNNLYAWGYSGHGEVGQNNTIPRSSPIQIPGKWRKVLVGNHHVICVDMQNRLWAWGHNNHGQLGLGDTINRSSPTQVGSRTDWGTVMAVSSSNTMITDQSGKLYSFGYNGHGTLGLGDGNPRSSPTAVFMSGWTNLTSQGNCAGGVIKNEDGTTSCWTWGHNGHTKLGHMDGTDRNVPTNVVINRSSAIQVGEGLRPDMFVNWHSVHANDYYFSFVDEGGGMWISGYNYQGQWPSSDWAHHASPSMYNFAYSSPIFLGSGFGVCEKDPQKSMARNFHDCWQGLKSNQNHQEESRNLI